MELEAELAVMEEEEAAKAKRRQEWEKKKKELAQLAEAKKVEEAITVAGEVAQKATASTKKAGKWRAEGPVEDEGASKKKTQEGNEDMDEVAQVVCHKCAFFFNLLYCCLTNDIRRCNNQQVECMQATDVWGKTCKVCLKAKQKCNALWGKVAVENSGFSAFSPTGLALLERLVVGVEKMGMGIEKLGAELVKVNKKLGMINAVLHEGTIEEADEIVNEGLDNEWYNMWCDKEMAEEVWELEKENEVFFEFCQEYKKGQEEDQRQVQVQEQEQEQGQEAE